MWDPKLELLSVLGNPRAILNVMSVTWEREGIFYRRSRRKRRGLWND